MKRIFYILNLILLHQILAAQTITVKQDSTGDYVHIQDAIDAATHGDTVLVWPGTYYENLIINDKNIVLGSLTLTTQDKQYNTQTIIDGSSDSATCVAIVYCDDYVELNGFTICKGWGFLGTLPAGGGVYFKYSTNASVKNCIVKNNQTSEYGGGIGINRSKVFLSSTSVFNNHAFQSGGGIHILVGELEFDPINRCNIYLNYSSKGTDIVQLDGLGEYPPVQVIVDTFTVKTPDYYYLMNGSTFGEVLSYEIKYSKIESVSQDLYVSPYGNNTNSGLNSAEPLKDIYFALLKMESDSMAPDTIHIANGIYNMDEGEKYPLSLKRDVSLKGASRDATILDANDIIYLMYGIASANNYSVSNLTLRNGNGNTFSYAGRGAFTLENNYNAHYENLLISNNIGSYVSGGHVLNGDNILFRNIEFRHNIGGNPLRIINNKTGLLHDTVFIESCQFIGNLPDYSIPDEGLGGSVAVIGRMFADYPNKITCIFKNCLFAKNRARILESGGGAAAALHALYSSQVYLVNCTFSENIAEHPERISIGVTNGSNMHIYNSLLYDNEPLEIGIAGSQDYPCSLNIYNSLVDGGENGIKYISDYNSVFYDTETNIDEDPLFLGKWEHPYQIDNGSPCINTGTLNLPAFIELPEFDLAGNPRIVGDSIDMGAYEWNPTVGIDEYQYQPIDNVQPKLLHVAPNPFRTETTITADWDFQGQVQIEIYNNSGLRVKQLKSGQSYGIGSLITTWDGKDQYGNVLPAGIYHVVLLLDEKEVESLKVVKP